MPEMLFPTEIVKTKLYEEQTEKMETIPGRQSRTHPRAREKHILGTHYRPILWKPILHIGNIPETPRRHVETLCTRSDRKSMLHIHPGAILQKRPGDTPKARWKHSNNFYKRSSHKYVLEIHPETILAKLFGNTSEIL